MNLSMEPPSKGTTGILSLCLSTYMCLAPRTSRARILGLHHLLFLSTKLQNDKLHLLIIENGQRFVIFSILNLLGGFNYKVYNMTTKYWIYWVGVNTKFCIYTLPVNSKFTIWQISRGVLLLRFIYHRYIFCDQAAIQSILASFKITSLTPAGPRSLCDQQLP